MSNDATVEAPVYRAPASLTQRILLLSIPVLALIYLLDVPARAGFLIWRQQYVVVVLGIALGAVFVRAAEDRDKVAAKVFRGLAVVSVSSLLYTAWQWPAFTRGSTDRWDVIVGVIVIALVLEASRHTVGKVLFLLGVLTLVYGMATNWLPGILGADVPWDRLAWYVYTDSSGLIGSPVIVTATVVLAFILFGAVLMAVGGGDVFVHLAMSLVGRYSGGAAKAAVVASSLFGSVSGSAVSNVVTTGSLTIPLMKRSGYPSHIAGGVEAVASTGGQLLPPVMGITAFLIADFLAMPYTAIVTAAVLPAILVYLYLFVQVHLEGARAGAKLTDEEFEGLPSLRSTVTKVWILVVPIVIMVHGLFISAMPPARAALYATGGAVVCGVIDRRGRITVAWAIDTLVDAGRKIIDLIVITAVAGIVIGVVSLTGLAFDLTGLVQAVSGGSLFGVLVITGIVALVLGMGMPTAGVYILLAVTAAPAVVAAGVPPLAAHLFILYYGMLSMVTPPICLAAFAASPLAESDPMRTGFAAMRLSIPIYVIPFVFVYSPSLLFIDATGAETGMVFASAATGAVVLAVAVAGYWRGAFSLPIRACLLAAGVVLTFPTVQLVGVTGAAIVNVAVGAGVVVLASMRVRSRTGRGGIPKPAGAEATVVETH